MNALNIPLVDWGNGVIMIGVFALVVVILVAVTISFMSQGGKKEDE
ncbi:MAG: hypothetical protein KJO05_11990 [Bacteroidia bacterium]|nr:hypothetical protein [Bacteroidia bacterium]NNF31807.1 hypothetical protein [Flavobacteriaceae bacterium]MBT8276236.1 hypothetical protein [Bacteroidia bacterium]NNJ81319.1 hypothetical protein [Flavobacteriaceae bacterium]NNK53354.1 hypothetical protein [Flavobacteriaceae bacterium]